MVDRNTALGFAAAYLCFLCGCTHLSQSEKIGLFVRLSGIDALSQSSQQQLELHLSAREHGVYRVVVPITADEAAAIRSQGRFGKWLPGPIPDNTWKSTIRMGGGREPPERFVPTYTNTLLYSYREDWSDRRMYVLDVTAPSKPILYFVYYHL